jgi:hypothetical protein
MDQHTLLKREFDDKLNQRETFLRQEEERIIDDVRLQEN